LPFSGNTLFDDTASQIGIDQTAFSVGNHPPQCRVFEIGLSGKSGERLGERATGRNFSMERPRSNLAINVWKYLISE
jgi:hypothetical protein